MMKAFKEGRSVADIYSSIRAEYKPSIGDRLFSQVSLQLKDHFERSTFLNEFGMELFQEKVVYVLDRYADEQSPANTLSFETAPSYGFDNLTKLIASVLECTLDRADKQDVIEKGSLFLAKETVGGDQGLLNGDKSWWQIGIHKGKAVGFVLPVKFDGSDKDGLIEGSIQLFGVLPEFRGNGFGTELLHRGCEILNKIGEWRIFNDIDTENLPSIRSFKRVGHKETDKVMKYHMNLV
jgi:ribosomal protein S18 acetylase RimI-like enzyme